MYIINIIPPHHCMNSQISKELPLEDALLPGSGTETVGAATNDLAAQIRSQVYVSWSGVTDVGQADSTDTVASEGVPEAKNSLSDAERTELFAALRTTLTMKENSDGAPAAGVVEAALMENPRMMFNLKRLQDAGAQLVVTDFQAGQYIEFADAALNLDIPKQGARLAGLTQQERNDAIETIVAPLQNHSQETMGRDWLLSQLSRSGDVRGLNFAEALVYAVAHGGTPISYELYDAMAQRGDPSVFENKTWTWYFKKLSAVINSGDAPSGYRYKGWADRNEFGADCRFDYQGGRVAGLRVQIS